MKKINILVILTTLFVLTMSSFALALSLTDFSPGDDIPNQNIRIIANYDGSFRGLSYIISSTGATSGIRYRTSAITVNINGHIATIDISSLVGHATSGQTNYSQITVTKEDIIRSLGEQYRSVVNNISPESIQIGANIQIYNAATGEVLATITNRNDVAPIASSIGFGSQDISDMESRFLQDNSGPVIIPDDPSVNPDGSGLRPSILVK